MVFPVPGAGRAAGVLLALAACRSGGPSLPAPVATGPLGVVIEGGRIVDGPHQLSSGIRDVYVNGVAVVRNGRHTGAKPGRIVHGPGWRAPR